MEARARSRFVLSSPRKIRQVADLIRGKRVNEALDTLHFMPKKGARILAKTLHSAVSNLMHMEGSRKLSEENLYVKEAFVDGGPMAKRYQPGPMGRAGRIRKRFSHVTVTVGDIEQS